MGIFWTTNYTVIDTDGTKRSETALEQSWFDRYNKRTKPGPDCKTFTNTSEWPLTSYKCTSTNRPV